MYKVILVDDEADVREGVVQEIDWNQYGFEIAAVAENGREAFELIEKAVPDVVITDISMPFLDGLELSKCIRENYPGIKIIILTGYDEFEYAKQAVSLQVEEYVLKPFSAHEIIDALVKIKNRITEEAAQKENMEVLLEHYKNSLPVLRTSFLASLITKRFKKNEILDKVTSYDIPLKGTIFAASVLGTDLQLPVTEDRGDPQASSENLSLKDSGDRELQLFAILNIAEDLCAQHDLGTVFIHGEQVVLVASCEGTSGDVLTGKLFPLLEEIRRSTEKYLGFSITLGVGSVTLDITGLKASYEEALSALDYRLLLGNNRMIYIADLEQKAAKEKPEFDELKEKELSRCLKMGTLDEMNELIESCFLEMKAASISFHDCQLYLLEIFISILKLARHSNIGTEKALSDYGNLLFEIQNFHNLQEAKTWILQLCEQVRSHIAKERHSASTNLVDMAKEYIKEHFHEDDLSISKVCKHLHISSGYFSYLFKKHVKTTFVNYLLNERMETAKELLSTTDLKSFEIAERVGYADPNYFSFSFKKYFGMTPKEFRSSRRGT